MASKAEGAASLGARPAAGGGRAASLGVAPVTFPAPFPAPLRKDAATAGPVPGPPRMPDAQVPAISSSRLFSSSSPPPLLERRLNGHDQLFLVRAHPVVQQILLQNTALSM